jgi:4-amino-4-deoxy-L-arabinose transferase-like glycosyltransferase
MSSRFGHAKAAPHQALAIGALVCFVAYASVIFLNTSFAVGGSDSSGYFNAARMLAGGRLVEPIRDIETYGLDAGFSGAFVPFGFVPGPRANTIAPLYPVGLPLHVAVVAALGGWSAAPYFLSPIAALAALMLIVLIGKELSLSRVGAFVSAGIVALCPFFVFMAIQPMADVPAMAWSLAAILFTLRARRNPSWMLAAGASFGIAFLVRPTSVLLLPVLAVASTWTWRRALSFLVGLLPFFAVFLAYNSAAYGKTFATGYGDAGLLSAFTLRAFPQRFLAYIRWLVKTMSPLLLLGALFFFLPPRHSPSRRALLLAWSAPFLLFFSCYAFNPDVPWWDLRFLLPAVPALVIGAVLVWQDSILPALRRASARSIPIAASIAVLAIVFGFELHRIRAQRLLLTDEDQLRYPRACALVSTGTPKGSLILSRTMSGAIRYYTPLTPARWDWFRPEQFQILRDRVESRGGTLYALLLPDEIAGLRELCPGQWTKIGETMDISLWKLERRKEVQLPPSGDTRTETMSFPTRHAIESRARSRRPLTSTG